MIEAPSTTFAGIVRWQAGKAKVMCRGGQMDLPSCLQSSMGLENGLQHEGGAGTQHACAEKDT